MMTRVALALFSTKRTLTPVGTPDFAEVIVGETVVIEPLLNDLSPSGAALRLLSIDEVPESVTAEINPESGRVSVTPTEPGAVYLKYGLGAEAATSVGLIRIEARPRPDEPLAPNPQEPGFPSPDEPSVPLPPGQE